MSKHVLGFPTYLYPSFLNPDPVPIVQAPVSIDVGTDPIVEDTQTDAVVHEPTPSDLKEE